MAGLVQCARCGQEAPALSRPPLPGESGTEVLQRICQRCWDEWTRMEVMVINELRLNFMDPRSQEILQGHMRQFLYGETPDQLT